MNHTLTATAADVPASSELPKFSRVYAWSVFALTFGLMLSDYLSRQMIGAVFPALKAEWALSDSQLGLLVSVVSIVVGVLTVPISLLADRWGRVRSITVMAFVWCLATVVCGQQSYACWSGRAWSARRGGLPTCRRRAACARLSGAPAPRARRVLSALFGSVLGVVLGSAMRPSRLAHGVLRHRRAGPAARVHLSVRGRDYKTVALCRRWGKRGSRSEHQAGRARCSVRARATTFIASGLQMAMPAMLIAWLPAYFAATPTWT
jgi:MFS family permease